MGLDPEIIAKTLGDRRSGASGLFFPETQIRSDWIKEHIQQLAPITDNESIGELDLDTWIQADLLKIALSSL
ncbi:MAG: hypothetical protein AB4290_30120 [Spirulina sp.]